MTPTKRVKCERVPWIGLVHVRPLHSATTIGAAGGAYAATLVFAATREDFPRLARKFFAQLDLAVIACDDIDTLAERLREGNVDPALMSRVPTLGAGDPVAVYTFDCYPPGEET